VQGKELSYNNLVDLEAARRLISEFPVDQPAAAVLKHTNPCGVALGDTLALAYRRAYDADPVSAFGGIVALNQAIDLETAHQLTGTFLECIVAPACQPEAQEVLASKPNLRLLLLEDLASGPAQEVRAIAGGFLLQAPDGHGDDPATWQRVTQAQPSDDDLAELLFAWRVVKQVKSNAIVVTNQQQTLGIGAGQMNRVGSVTIALNQAGDRSQGAVLASDGFFPFEDSVRAAAAAGIRAIIQPGGSRRDQESIQAADQLGLIMVLTGVRHFLH
jgi:phosphoribosylaminoimidazolecarboxamide formyltransferase/IMP cyclohydrolase